MSRAELKLVWSRSDILAEPAKPNTRGKQAKEEQKPSWIIPLIAPTIAIITLLIGGGFFFGALTIRTEFGERMVGVETNVKGLEKKVDFILERYVLKDPELKAKAEKILTVPNVQIAYVTPSSNVKFTAPFKAATSLGGSQELSVVYTIQELRSDALIILAQIVEKKDGKTRIVQEEPIELKLPATTGKPTTLDIRISDSTGAVVSSPIRIELVVLERIGPDLIIATGIKPTDPTVG